MTLHTNEHGQPVGFEVPDWQGALPPTAKLLPGRYCHVERLDANVHAADLFAANSTDSDGVNWTYLPYGPFDAISDYRDWVEEVATADDLMFYAIRDLARDQAVGVASYLRVALSSGAVEVGHINFSPLLQRSRAGTEAMFLMMQYVFEELGYRRYEWKCNALNEPSRSAAIRFGFTYEGTFRYDQVVKGRNRDTAWYAMVNNDWPGIKERFVRWLAPTNFDDAGEQKSRLSAGEGARAS
ncbi:MAG TPA: GNAT family protein [Actinomycetes bacterium]|nr:GNAT family protein [Actinomycetes bacterium]